MNITRKAFFNTKFSIPYVAGASAVGGGAYYLGRSYAYNPSMHTEYAENCFEAIKQANQGKLQVDLPRLVTTMGASMYGRSIVEVAVKELLQNAFDSVKEAIYKSFIQEGDIKIHFCSKDRSITIEDNGMGMSPEIIQEAFFTIGGSRKDMPPTLCSGGYGQAKVAFLLSVEKIHISSTQNGIRTEITTTPGELLNGHFTISTYPDAKTKRGTKIRVWIPQNDNTGRSIYFPEFISSCLTLANPLIGPTKVTASTERPDFPGQTKVLPLGIYFNKPVYANVTFDWGTATVYFDPSPASPYTLKHSILSSGVFQFDHKFNSLPEGTSSDKVETIPHNIIIDIKPNVAPDNANYPFTNNREAFRPQVSKDIEKLRAYLVKIEQYEKDKRWIDAFSFSKCMETPQLWKPLVKEGSPTDNNTMSSRLYSLFRGNTEPLKTDRPIPLLALEAIPCKEPIFVNGMNNSFSIEESDLEMREFFFELASIFSLMKDAMAKSAVPVYRNGKEYYTGIGIMKDAHGINMNHPLRAILLNPLSPPAKSIDGICRNLMTTMIHELAHFEVADHGVNHNQAMKVVESYLADRGILEDVQTKLKALLTKNKEAFEKWQKKFDKALTALGQQEDIFKGCR